MNYKILIVDDDVNIRTMLKLALETRYDVLLASNSQECMDIIAEKSVDICLLDLCIGSEDGMKLLQAIKESHPQIAAIMMTAYGSIRSSVEAMKAGAATYLSKPLDLEELYIQIEKLVEVKELNKKIDALESEISEQDSVNRIIGQSKVIDHLKNQINQLKNNNVNILIRGESGTGKELVARALHFSGNRNASNFIALNCAAIPEDLLEEEMFGHKKGAFTGAYTDTKGKFELADKGTIFLDEIGDMPLHLQSKLLRVIETKEYYPVGASERKSVNVRILAATNKNLEEMVQAGTFRSDLYYRLSVITVNIPSMRERKEDLPLLIRYFIGINNKKHGKSVTDLSPRAWEALTEYDYPGNVRELINIIEYAVIFSTDGIIHLSNLPDSILKQLGELGQKSKRAGAGGDAHRQKKDYAGETLKEIGKRAIEDALSFNGGNIVKTAAMLGVSDKGLRNKIKALEIEVGKP